MNRKYFSLDILRLKDICDALGTVKHKWLKIGVQLGIPYHVLEEFKEENDPLAAVINYWLNGNVEGVKVCWESIITALKSPHVEERGLAENIFIKYSKQSISSSQEDEGMHSSMKRKKQN